jgi:5-methyltetrahydrofolate--homocysteine methyltransferase
MQNPNQLGTYLLYDIDLKEIFPFIDWRFFFHAWKIPGKFDDIETVCDCTSCTVGWLQQFSESERPKAEEALKLYKDAQELLRLFLDEKAVRINAAYTICEAHSEEDNIVFTPDDRTVVIPTLRQQHPSADGFCYSLADFLSPESDFAGAFCTTIQGIEELAARFEQKEDVYSSILVKTIADRLAEATAEWLHWKVRTEFWGYAADENLSVKEMLKSQFKGIRPAVGYPSLPDQSIIFDLQELLPFAEIGITLTENGAMFPNASVCGLYFAHPQSKYFMVGKIDDNQLNDYAKRKGKSPEEIEKWLISNL